MAIEIRHQLPPGPEAVAQARRALDPLSEGLSEADLMDLRLVVSELVTNSVRHAIPRRRGPVGLAVRLADDHACVEVHDPGPGFRVPEQGPRARDDSGWGLVLVDQLAESWGVEGNGRTRVWCRLRLPRDGGRRGRSQGCGNPGRQGPSAPAGTV